MKPMVKDAELKFEYGNNNFHAAQLFVNDVLLNENNLIIKLAVTKTDCKAKETCGVPEVVVAEDTNEPCCDPVGNCC